MPSKPHPRTVAALLFGAGLLVTHAPGAFAQYDAASVDGIVESIHGYLSDLESGEVVTGRLGAFGAVASGAMATGALASGAIATGALAAGTVKASKVTAGTVAADAVNANTVAADAMSANTVTAGAMTASTVAADAMTANTVAADAMSANTVTAGAMTASTVAADAMTAHTVAADAMSANTVTAGAMTASTVAADAMTANTVAAGAVSASTVTADAVAAGTVAADAVSARVVTDGTAALSGGNLAGVGTAQIGAVSTNTLSVGADATVAGNLAVGGTFTAGSIADGLITLSGQGLTNQTGHGLTLNSASTTLSGGENSTTIELDDGGMNVIDSANGTTFSVSNTGDATIAANATVGGDLAVGGAVSASSVATGTVVATENAYLGGTAADATLAVTPGAITIASGTTVDMGGNRVTNVADAVADSDAVNLRQLNTVRNELQNQISDNRREARRGIANVAAIAGIPSVEVGKRFSLGVGVGSFRSEHALAIGASGRVSERLTAKLALSMSGGEKAVSAGAAFSF